jgi:hypothetical protein
MTEVSAHTIERFWSKVEKTNDCWIWLGCKTKSGYGYFALTRRKTVRAHRFAYEATFGVLTAGLCALHRCDNPGCVRPDHLFSGTHAENMADRDAKGRTARGDRSGARTQPAARPRGDGHARSKLSGELVARIKARIRSGESQTAIASDVGVSIPTINHIVKGRTWRHIA